jgi:hypothetical protein
MFGTIFAIGFIVAHFGFDTRLSWAPWVAGCFFALALFIPWLLMPLNRLWENFAHRLSFVSNHLLLGLFFFLFVCPFALILRAFGSDPMDRKFEPKVDTYWTKVTRHADAKTFADMF